MDIPKISKASVLPAYETPHIMQDIEIPELNDGDVLVKVLLAGVCGTDVHQYLGHIPAGGPIEDPPVIQGHEVIGKIVKSMGVTEDVVGNELKEGDRVIWCHQWCGKCYSCRILGQPFMCDNSAGYGFADPKKLRGGYAEYELITAGTDILKVPESVKDEEALGIGCAFRSAVSNYETLLNHGGIKVGENVVVQGVGPIGLYCTVLAAQSPAAKIITIDMSEPRLEFSKKWGATHTISMNEYTTPEARREKILELTGGRGADVVFEASGAPASFVEGVDMLAKMGRYVVIGQASQRTVDFAPGKILEKYCVILGNKGADIRHFYKALNFIDAYREKYPFGDIISHKFPLTEADKALEVSMKGIALKAVIDNRD